jgi:hypothetical protein
MLKSDLQHLCVLRMFLERQLLYVDLVYLSTQFSFLAGMGGYCQEVLFGDIIWSQQCRVEQNDVVEILLK